MTERPFDESSASSRARDPGVALAVDMMLPFAGLRNFASTRRTTATTLAEEPKCLSKELTAGCLGERELSARVNCAEMIEILAACWQFQ